MVALHHRNHVVPTFFLALSLEPFFQRKFVTLLSFRAEVVRKQPRETTERNNRDALPPSLSLSVRHVCLGQTRRPFRQTRQSRVQSALDAKRTKETKSKTRRVADEHRCTLEDDKDARRSVAKNSVSLEIPSTAIRSLRGDQIERV